MDKNILYICSSENTIKYSEIPIYDGQYKFYKKLKNENYIKNSNITLYKIKS